MTPHASVDAPVRTIRQTTKVELALIVSLVGVIAGGAWWASAISTKMDNVILALSKFDLGDNAVLRYRVMQAEEKIARDEERITRLEMAHKP